MKKALSIFAGLALLGSAFGFIKNTHGVRPAVAEADQDLLVHQQTLQGSRAPVNMTPPKPSASIPLPAADSRAASVVAAASNLVADASSTGTTDHHVELESPAKGPITAVAIGFGAFFIFWFAGRRQLPSGQ